jgi:hypothetical protein
LKNFELHLQSWQTYQVDIESIPEFPKRDANRARDICLVSKKTKMECKQSAGHFKARISLFALKVKRLVLVEIYIKQFVLAARAAFRSAVWLCQTVGLLSNPLWLRHSLAARGAREEKESRR